MWNIPLKNKFLLARDIEDYKKYIKSQYNIDIVINFKIIHREDYGNIISILNEIGNNLIKEKGLVGNLENKRGKRLITYYKHCIWKILQELGISNNVIGKKYNVDRSTVKIVIDKIKRVWDYQKEYENIYNELLNKLIQDERFLKIIDKK